tara:strand:- start:8965 stop:10602 length:1638 start_codon:yes stop_codon:yes gene_type:complete
MSRLKYSPSDREVYTQPIVIGRHTGDNLAELPGVKAYGRGEGIPMNCFPLIGDDTYEDDRGVRPLILSDKLKPWVKDWLTEYQREGLRRVQHHTGALFYWACGAGKTAAAVAWATMGPTRSRTVVVTRAGTKQQWKREVEKLTNNCHPTILYGQTGTPIPRETEWVILSWEILPHWKDQLVYWMGGGPSNLIFDELHRGKSWIRREKYVRQDGSVGYRNKKNVSSSAAGLSRAASRRLGLTATPVRDRLSDLWAQLDLLEPDCWGSNWDFVHRYCDAVPGKFGGLNADGKSNVKELNLRMKTMTHVVKRAEMTKHLPPMRRQLAYLSKGEQSKPSAFSKDLKAAAKRGKQALFEMKLLEAASRKRKWITDLAKDSVEAGQKVTIFTGRRKDCERLAESIQKALPNKPVWCGHGGHPTADRDMLLRSYIKNETGCVLVATTDAFGEAVDGLQHTDLCCFALLPWTPGSVTQAEGRFIRQGQSRPCLIMYTVAEGTVDEHVADVLLNKLETVGEALEDEQAQGIADTLAGSDDEDAVIQSILELFEE